MPARACGTSALTGLLECRVPLDLILAFLLALAPTNPTTVTLTAGGKTAAVAAAEEGTLLSIPDVVAALGGNARPQPGSSLAVEIAGHRIVCADGVATAAFDDRVVMLSHPTREFAGTLYAPWEFFEKTVLPAAGLSGEYDRAGRRIRARSFAVPSAVIDVALVHLNQTTQVVLRESAATPFEARLEGDTYFVRFKSPVTEPFAEKSYDDPYVARIRFQNSTAAIRLTGQGLTATSYALRSPDRIVVEVSPARPTSPPPVALPAPPPARTLARTVVIDPGHGGDETGAVGPGGLLEKDVTLDIARRLAAVLARGGSIRPVLTRTSDTLVALDERAAIANHEKAAVFI
jgi:N-acetylmuramoyl-L-alanine amidase